MDYRPLFATDRETYVVQGWTVPGQETSVEIPHKLLQYLEPDTELAAPLQDTGRDSYILSGAVVVDAEALAQTDMPGHETSVEVGRVRGGGADETAHG